MAERGERHSLLRSVRRAGAGEGALYLPRIRSRSSGSGSRPSPPIGVSPIDALDVHVIRVASMRLDLAADQSRLQETARELRPKLLVLDPLVRIHRIDENDASQVSALLSSPAGTSAGTDLSVVLVHHTRKNHSWAQAARAFEAPVISTPGPDSALYLRKSGELSS
jgi:hypothetical protein